MSSTYQFARLGKITFGLNRSRRWGHGWLGRHGKLMRFGGVVKMSWGKGAGYIGGWTIFIAFRSGQLDWQANHRNWGRSDGKRHGWFVRLTHIQFAITRNANLVPYA